MSIPDKWKQPPLQAKKEDQKLTESELVAKLLSTGLARSSMEAKQMANSMLNIETTQKQFETEINKIHNAPRNKPAPIESAASIAASLNPGNSAADAAVEGIGKSQSLLLAELTALKDHVARQQQTIERLEQDVSFIRSRLQQAKTGEPQYPRTPTAAELLEAQDKANQPEGDAQTDLDPDDTFITPSK